MSKLMQTKTFCERHATVVFAASFILIYQLP